MAKKRKMSPEFKRRYDETTRLLRERIDYHTAKIREVYPDYETPKTFEEYQQSRQRWKELGGH